MVWTILLKGCVHRELEQYSKASEKKNAYRKGSEELPETNTVLKKYLLDKWYRNISGTFC